MVGYSEVSHDNHMQATWHESDWCDRIQKCHVSKPQRVLNVYQILFPLEDGVGDETSMHLNEIIHPIIGGQPNSQREIVIISSTVGAVMFVLLIAIVVIMIGICYYVSDALKKKSDLYVVI